MPDGAPESDAPKGLIVGPPSLEPLGLPLEIEVRIHNELFYRQLLTAADVRKRRMDVIGALMSALKVDGETIVQLYQKEVKDVPIQQAEVATEKQVKRARRR